MACFFNTEAERFHLSGRRVAGVSTKALSGEYDICPVCGRIQRFRSKKCCRFGYQREGFVRGARPARMFQVDFYLLVVAIPGVCKLLGTPDFEK